MFNKIIFLFALATAALGHYVTPIMQHHLLMPKINRRQPQPYKFGYSVKDKHGEQHRQEVGDGHSGVQGSYGFTDDRGVQRQVNYVADKLGFRAEVKTNEPGTANQDPAAVKIISSAHPYFGAGVGYGLGAGNAGYGGMGYGGGLGYGTARQGGLVYGTSGFGSGSYEGSVYGNGQYRDSGYGELY